jgi:lysophospholipase L1-like esterase
MRHLSRRLGSAVLAAVFCASSLSLHAQEAQRLDPDRWEPAIQAFEAKDRVSPQPKGQIVFVGASSIVRWNLAEYFPDLKAINRGFGGSFMADSARYASRIVTPYQPRIVVLYPGENDIARGVKAEAVAASFQEFMKTVHAALPATRVLVIGLKPTPARWEFMDEMRKTNTRFQAICQAAQPCTYISVEKEMLGANQEPRPELFVADRQHLSPEGYKIWTAIVRPHLN